MSNERDKQLISILMDKVRVGIAGYGVVGKRRHEYLKKHPAVTVVAVCDQLFPTDQKQVDGIRCYPNYRDLLADQDIDALFVCLTNDLAANATIAGLQNSLHVFCEKPPGRDVADVIRVMDVEKRSPGQKLMYGFNHRYHHSVRKALDLVGSGSFGKIINIRGLYGKSKLVTFDQPDWRTKREVAGGGILLDQGIHMVDLIRLFAGEFVEVHSFVSNNFWNYDVEDNAYALMRTKDGIVAMLNSSATQWRHRFELEVSLQEGSLRLGGILSGSKSYGEETLTILTTNSSQDQGAPEERVIHYEDDPSWASEITEFIKCVQRDIEVSSGSSKDALETMRLVYKIYYADLAWRDRFGIEKP